MFRHSQNTNGSRMAPQTAVSLSASRAKANFGSVVVNAVTARQTKSVFVMRIQPTAFESRIERYRCEKLGFSYPR